MSQVSSYRLDDLFTPDADRSRLSELEGRLLGAVTSDSAGGGGLAADGLEVSLVGISAIELPESVTENVFERMRADRERLVKALESEGAAQAKSIRDRANADAEKIRQFAAALAAEIEALGERESAQYLQRMAANPELAVFLANLEFLKTAYAKRATLVFSTASPAFILLNPDLWETASASDPIPGVEPYFEDGAQAERTTETAAHPAGRTAAPAQPDAGGQ